MSFLKRILNNNKGSAGMLAFLGMCFFGIIGGAYVTLSNSSIQTSANLRDSVAAQYLAEAGAQWALAELKVMPSYGDIKIVNPPVKKNTNTTTAGQYEVTVEKISTTDADGKTIIEKKITSIGTVNKSTRTVVLTLTPGGGIFGNAIYSRDNLAINGGAISGKNKIIGSVASDGKITITTGNHDTISEKGIVYCKEFEDYNHNVKDKSEIQPPTGEKLDVNRLMMSKPKFLKNGIDITTVPIDKNGKYNLTNGSYYYDGNYAMYSHGYNVPDGQAATIYINGDFEIGKDIIGNNITLYINGKLTFANGASIIQDPEKYKINVYATGNVEWNSNVVNGRGLIVTNGNIHLNRGASAEQTIFIAGGNIEVNDNSKVGALYANGTLAISNGAVVDYDRVKNFASELNQGPLVIKSWSDNSK